MYTVVTGRFNNETMNANYNYRRKKNLSCIYCVPMELSAKIHYDTPVFVIEMNNSSNRIEGIGLIKNRPSSNRYYKVHDDGNTNRFIYIGDYFMDRETIIRNNPFITDVLDEILFKGKTHSKRGSGLSIIPEKVLKFDICNGRDIKKEIKELFIYHFRDKQSSSINLINFEMVDKKFSEVVN
jgi:hypothetical protein